MQNKCVVLLRRDLGATFSHLLERCGYALHEANGERLDERDILAILAEKPFAIVLPLSLPGYASVRIAELVALHRFRTRLILVSGTSAPDAMLHELFDCHLPPRGEGLFEALQRHDWTHAFERRSVTIDTAIQDILRTASCFWLSGERHPELFATLVDYQRKLVETSKHLNVLFVASDPTDVARLCLIKELAAIEQELAKRSEYSFSLRYAFSSRPDELMRKLLEEKPHIVHFSGHGDSEGRLCFEHPSGRSWPANKAAIAEIFKPSRRYVKCVVLNACFSAEQAQLVGQHIEYAIGLKSSVADDAAIAMAKGFYGALGATGRVSNAVRAARANLHLVSSGNSDLYCAQRIPEFRGFVAGAVDSATRDPELCEQLAKMDRWVTEHITVPIPPGSRCETSASSVFSTDEHGELIARFIVPDPTCDVVTFYTRWAQHDGWFIEGVYDHEIQGMLRLVKGTHCATFGYMKSNNDVSLSIRLWQQTYIFRG